MGYNLFHEGLLALAEVEANGIRIDMPLLQKTKTELTDRIRVLKEECLEDTVWKTWRRRFPKANLTSRDQLSAILYDELGIPKKKFTAKGKASVDDEALQNIDHPFVRKVAELYRYDKTLGTFLLGIESEVVAGFLHPVFNLHIARSLRSSSDSPNFQNFPVRNKEIAKIIRSLFIPRALDSILVENDFKGIEVSVSACYHKDANFISYITTPGKDMHRDMAAQIYCLRPEDVSKDARYGAKNKFVFPQFYGDYYRQCAINLWDWIIKGNLTNKASAADPAAIPLIDHLKEKGIRRRGECDPEKDPVKGTFEHHVQQVENDFWNNRFMDYGKWRKQAYRDYLDRGYFDYLTGFRAYGVFDRKIVTNYPIQGSAFHCLLWTLIQVNKKLRKYKMQSKVVGQIHDSLIGDVKIKELRDYLSIVEETATVELRKYMDWLVVPLEIEYEICPIGSPWFDKKEVKFKNGQFKHPTKDIWTKNQEKFLQALSQAA